MWIIKTGISSWRAGPSKVFERLMNKCTQHSCEMRVSSAAVAPSLIYSLGP